MEPAALELVRELALRALQQALAAVQLSQPALLLPELWQPERPEPGQRAAEQRPQFRCREQARRWHAPWRLDPVLPVLRLLGSRPFSSRDLCP